MSDNLRRGIPKTDHSILRLQLVGPMQALTLGNENVLPAGRKTRGLLAIVAMAGRRPVLRSKLAELLWSRRSEEQARASLRQEIHRLLDALAPLGAPVLEIERHAIALRPGLTTVDAERLLNTNVNQIISLAGAPGGTRIGQPQAGMSAGLASAGHALPPLDGVLLEELNGTDPALDAWLIAERRRLREHARTLFEAALQRRPEPLAAITICQQLLLLDPLDEAAWRELVRCQMQSNQRGAAVETAERCIASFRRQATEPGEETTRLLADLRRERAGGEDGSEPAQTTVHAVGTGDAAADGVYARAALAGTAPASFSTGSAGLARLAVLPLLDLRGDHPTAAPGLLAPGLLAPGPLASGSLVSGPLVSGRADAATGQDQLSHHTQSSMAHALAEELVAGLALNPLLCVLGGSTLKQAIARGRDDVLLRRSFGVDYLLDGTILHSRSRVRIIVRLLDLRLDGQVVWARRFDHAPAEAADRLDEIALMVCAQLPWEVLLIESRRVGTRPAAETHATPLGLRAFALMMRPERAASDLAGELLQRAEAQEPGHPLSVYLEALRHFLRAIQFWEQPAEAGMLAQTAIRKAFSAGYVDAQTVALAGLIHGNLLDEPHAGLALIDSVLASAPHLSIEHAFAASVLARIGELDEAERRFNEYKRLVPLHPLHHLFDGVGVLIDLLQGRTARAAARGRELVELLPFLLFPALPCLAALGQLGLHAEAERLCARIDSLQPGLTIEDALDLLHLRRADDRSLFADGLRLAGMAPRTSAQRGAGDASGAIAGRPQGIRTLSATAAF